MGKKQHYVPRFLLRNFANDSDGKQIGIYLIKENRVITNGALYSQAYRYNLYGADQIIENQYQEFETKASIAIRKLQSDNKTISEEEYAFLQIFIVFQMNRTPSAFKMANDMFDKQMKEIFKYDSKVNKHFDNFRIEFTQPHIFLFQISCKIAYVLSDLKLGLLENNTSVPFLLGQHPVVVLNPFLVERKWIGSKKGLAAKGAIIFLPISPNMAVLLYDSCRYKLASWKKIAAVSEEDVHILNKCQFFTQKTAFTLIAKTKV